MGITMAMVRAMDMAMDTDTAMDTAMDMVLLTGMATMGMMKKTRSACLF